MTAADGQRATKEGTLGGQRVDGVHRAPPNATFSTLMSDREGSVTFVVQACGRAEPSSTGDRMIHSPACLAGSPDGGCRSAMEYATDEIERLRARIDRMMANCEWCQEGASPSGGFSPCPLHEGAEEGTVTKDEINTHFVLVCPNCGRPR
jgi:hypothetical protein